MVVDNAINTGEVNITVDTVKYAIAYQYQYFAGIPSEDTVWVTEGSTSRSYTITGLTPGVKYAFRVIALDTREQATYSDVVYKIAQ